MLNSPIRLFEESTDNIAPFPSSKEIKIKYPLLYKAEKDGKTHYLLGTNHAIDLDYMPDYILKIIEKCKALLSEGPVFLSKNHTKLIAEEGSFYKNFNFLELLKDCEKDLRHDLTPFLKMLNIECNLDRFSISLLVSLFNMYILHGADYGKIRMDDSLIFQFKEQKKTIIDLTTDDCEVALNSLIAYEEEIKENPKKIESFALEYSQFIIDSYSSLKKGECNKNEDEIKVILSFLNEDLEIPKPTVVITNDEKIRQNNIKWKNIFTDAHEKHDGMLLACGAGHLISFPEEPENSIISLLKKEGFLVSRLTNNEIDLSFQSLTLQYEHYQEQTASELCSNKLCHPSSPMRML